VGLQTPRAAADRRQYSKLLQDWLRTVPLPRSNLRGPQSRFLVIDPSAASFKVQAYQDGWQVADGLNAVEDGIRLLSTLLGLGRVKIHQSCRNLLDELPGYSWDDRASERGVDVPIKAEDHGIDALRYAVATTRAMWQQFIPVAA
jgi:hypothetical protein